MKLVKDAEDLIVKGIGILHGYIDEEGEFRICLLDPREVYIDPNSKEEDASDAAHILIRTVSSKERIQDLYPNFALSAVPFPMITFTFVALV